jgi:hypothetical protein
MQFFTGKLRPIDRSDAVFFLVLCLEYMLV